ncbi:MAG: PAS domain-containing protein, partial [Gemmatimonadales bacterium]
MLCVLDFGGYFNQLNPAWERTLGFSRQELMSRPFIEVVHPEDRERTLNQNSDVRAGGQAIAFENRYLCKDGSFRWFVWNAVPDAEERSIYSVARDLTPERQAAEERKRLREALAGLKHKGPIMAVCSYCTKLRDEDESWLSLSQYLARYASIRLSHGIC